MGIARKDWAFVFGPRDEVIDSTHPDFDQWMEAAGIDDWISDGAPPLNPGAPYGATDTPSAPERPEKSTKPSVAAPAKLAVGLGEAAALLSASDDHFRKHIKPELRILRRGSRQFVAILELERWLSESSAP